MCMNDELVCTFEIAVRQVGMNLLYGGGDV